jgi:hypothetical protein
MDDFSIILTRPISDDMINSWSNPDKTNPLNCVPCVALFFGFINQTTFNYFNELVRNRGMNEKEINTFFSNLLSEDLTKVIAVHYVPDLYDEMPTNHGIMLFIIRSNDTKHACILAKDSNNEIVMIDPQIQKAIIGRENVNNYFETDQVVRAFVLTTKAETGTNQEKRRRLTGGNKKIKYNKRQNITKNKRTRHSKKQKTTRNKKYRHFKK